MQIDFNNIYNQYKHQLLRYMVHQHTKHVTIVCSLNIGDVVTTDVGGYKTKGETTITDIKLHVNCESGVMVKTKNYDSWHDSNWVTVVKSKHE